LDALSTIAAALTPAGLNLCGVADVARYDAAAAPSRRSEDVAPGARSIVVVASGGAALWEAFVADLRRHPEHLTEEQHPLDAFVRRAVLAASLPGRWFFAAAEAEVRLDFRVLGEIAGLGGRSRLGLLLHPTFGPWLGLRACAFLDESLSPAPVAAPDPCAGCPAPCVTACPGSAFTEGRWDVFRCSAFHAESERCATSCDARDACPVGAAHRYPADELLYHYDRRAGRARLREQLGISGDRYEGIGPFWTSWREGAKK
jgi:epoxyqueuosine reductase